MGWSYSDPNRELFEWKHRENPAGASAMWVAEHDGRIVGFRTFLRWRFRQRDRDVVAVRAVDTATHPDYQGRGIFSRLTLQGLDSLAAESTAFVFNTPNNNSRPGYLKMGWSPVGRLPVAVRIAGPTSAARMLRARVPAERWSLPTSAGDPALHVLSSEVFDGPASDDETLTTARTLEHLRWRYGFTPLHYRGMTRPEGGVVIFRIRRRGAAREAAICELHAASSRARARLLGEVLRGSGADYAISLGSAGSGLPLPGQGPLLVQRPLTGAGPTVIEGWALSLGDIELF
jgi:GNAT superfamily N-acetyltransferase